MFSKEDQEILDKLSRMDEARLVGTPFQLPTETEKQVVAEEVERRRLKQKFGDNFEPASDEYNSRGERVIGKWIK